MTAKLYREIQVGYGSQGKWRAARGAYRQSERDLNDDAKLQSLDPGYWDRQLVPKWGEAGLVIRYADLIDDDLPNDTANHFGMTARLALEGEHEWQHRRFEAAKRAVDNGLELFWYWGAMGRSPLDAMSKLLIDRLPGTHIIDASNGGEFVEDLWDKRYWGEAFPDTRHEVQRSSGAYCFASNLRLIGGDRRLATTTSPYYYPSIISCHTDEDAAWLADDDETSIAYKMSGRTGVPNWRSLLDLNVSLAFRDDTEAEVNTFVGGMLAEMREVAG